MDEVAKNALEIAKAITSFAALGQSGWIGAGILTVLTAAATWYLSRMSKKARVDEANAKTERQRVDAGGSVPQEGREAERQGSDAASEIDQAVKKAREDAGT